MTKIHLRSVKPHVVRYPEQFFFVQLLSIVRRRGGGLGSSTIFKNLMSPTPRRKRYLTTGRRAH